mmetsp:Transcript_34556/g.84619  ORF Transcript_34556/g.84619 Transcript_34556/m.84619 type:complete len:545 (-) Transcript_34556:12-1646(-)
MFLVNSSSIQHLVRHPRRREREKQRRRHSRRRSKLEKHISAVSHEYGLARGQRRLSRQGVTRYRTAKFKRIVRIIRLVVTTPRYGVIVKVGGYPDPVQQPIRRSQLPVHETIPEARMTHAGSVDAHASVVARRVLLVGRVPRTHGYRAIQPLVRGPPFAREAVAHAVAQGVVPAVVAHAVAVAVVQAVVLAARQARRRELAFALPCEPVALPAVVALLTDLVVPQVVEVADVIRARDVGAVCGCVPGVAHAKVVLAQPVPRAILRARGREILPQVVQLLVAVLLAVVVGGLDPQVWVGAQNRVPVLVHVDLAHGDLPVPRHVVLRVPLQVHVVDTVHVAQHLGLGGVEVVLSLQAPVPAEDHGAPGLLRRPRAELRRLPHRNHGGPVPATGKLPLTHDFDPRLPGDVVVPQVADLVVPRVAPVYQHHHVLLLDADGGRVPEARRRHNRVPVIRKQLLPLVHRDVVPPQVVQIVLAVQRRVVLDGPRGVDAHEVGATPVGVPAKQVQRVGVVGQRGAVPAPGAEHVPLRRAVRLGLVAARHAERL